MSKDARVKDEIKRLTSILNDAGISKRRIDALESVIENTAWMKIKLDDARDAVQTSNVVIPYDNGGGQKGLRENPIFKGYESLWKSYMAGMGRLLECLPAEQATIESETANAPKTMLELVREKHKKQA